MDLLPEFPHKIILILSLVRLCLNYYDVKLVNIRRIMAVKKKKEKKKELLRLTSSALWNSRDKVRKKANHFATDNDDFTTIAVIDA